jgi:hypothetical protein
MSFKRIYIEFSLDEKNYKNYEYALEDFVTRLQNECEIKNAEDISVQEIDEGEMYIQF